MHVDKAELEVCRGLFQANASKDLNIHGGSKNAAKIDQSMRINRFLSIAAFKALAMETMRSPKPCFGWFNTSGGYIDEDLSK